MPIFTTSLPYLLGRGSAPSVAAGTGAGTGAAVTTVGNNISGKITLVQGTGGIAGGQILVLTMADGWTFPTSATITFSAGNANFASILASIYVTMTANSATLMLNGLNLTAGVTYVGYYHVVGY